MKLLSVNVALPQEIEINGQPILTGLPIRAALGMQKLGEGDADSLRRALAIDSPTPLLRRDFEKHLAAQTAR